MSNLRRFTLDNKKSSSFRVGRWGDKTNLFNEISVDLLVFFIKIFFIQLLLGQDFNRLKSQFLAIGL